MNNTHRLRELKIKASLLLKQLRAPDTSEAAKAAGRFKILHFLSGKSPAEIILLNKSLRLKHAYMVIALENGFSNWSELKRRIVAEDCLYPPKYGGFLNAWYKDYATARKHLEMSGGYLLQYRQYFFVCEETYIDALGLGHLRREWEKIAYDWVKPADPEAWNTIFFEAQHSYLQRL